MEKLTNNRLYLDYNSTSPFAASVKDWLAKGDLFFSNPSSIHSTGKQAKRVINETREFLYKTFGLDENEFGLFFHSGATEGMNTLIKGHAKTKRDLNFFHGGGDHACVKNQSSWLLEEGHDVHEIHLDKNGQFDKDALIEKIKNLKGTPLISWTHVNNETGIVLPLTLASEIKAATGCSIIVDSAQVVGKIKDWKALSKDLDAYTFSGHKFGSLKGIGFTFYRKDFNFFPLIVGGGQQEGYRSGTMNASGIYSLKLALEDIINNENYSDLKTAHEKLEENLSKLLGEKGFIVGTEAPLRNANTSYIIFKEVKGDTIAMALDMEGVDVSLGSACASGAVKPSTTLMAMGYTETEAKSGIRISYSPSVKASDAESIFKQLESILSRHLS